MTDSGRTISHLAEAVGVNVETIRYYERRGLIKQPTKPLTGWRRYDDAALRTVRFIKRAQQLGFSLDQIEDLMKLTASNSERTCARVRSKARAKLDEIDSKVRDLKAMREVLAELANTCPGSGPAQSCPILEAIIADGESGDA